MCLNFKAQVPVFDDEEPVSKVKGYLKNRHNPDQGFYYNLNFLEDTIFVYVILNEFITGHYFLCFVLQVKSGSRSSHAKYHKNQDQNEEPPLFYETRPDQKHWCNKDSRWRQRHNDDRVIPHLV